MGTAIERRYSVYIEVLTNNIIYPKMPFINGDTLSFIDFYFKSGSNDLDLTGKTFVVNIVRPNNTTGSYFVRETSGNKATWKLQNTATNGIGKYIAEIAVYDGEDIYTTFKFNYSVEDNIAKTDGIVEDEKYNVLVDLIDKVKYSGENESERIANETTRVSNENVRILSESTRGVSETTRNNNEVTRTNNENTRKTNETSRANAESTRVTSENKRITDETSRVNAEATRVSNESVRVTNENTRISNENSRKTAETSRVNAESTRVTEFNAIKAEFDAFKDTITDVVDVAELKTKVGAIEGNIATLNGNVTDVDNKANATNVQLGLLETKVSGIETDLLGSKEALDGKINTNTQDISSVKNDIYNGVTNSATLSYGMNSKITNNSKVSQIPEVTFTGKHYVNLLGKGGSFENDKWSVWAGTKSISNRKLTLTGNGTAVNPQITNVNIGRVPPINTKILIRVKIKVLHSCTYIHTYLYSATTGTLVADRVDNPTVNQEYTLCGAITVTQSVIDNWDSMSVRVAPNYSIASNSNGCSVEISDVLLTLLPTEDNSLTKEQLLVKYPYVDSYGVLTNPYVEIRHDNLVRNGNCEEGVSYWIPTYSTSSLTIEDGKFKVTDLTQAGQFSQYINVKPNTTYSIKKNIIKGSVGGTVQVRDTLTNNVLANTGDNSFNSGDSTRVRVIMRADNGYAYFDSIMLVEGSSVPPSYKPCRIERCVIEGQFADGDSVTLKNGKAEGLINWKHKTLFGKDYDWGFSVDFVGYKTIYVNYFATGLNFPTSYCVDHNCGIVPFGDVGSINNAHVINNGALYMSIPDGVSGWVETINPNNDEVKAFMNGWKAISNNGTRYTVWVNINNGSYPSGAMSTKLSSDYVVNSTSLTVSDASIFSVNNKLCVICNDGTMQSRTITAISGNTLTITAISREISSGTIIVKEDDGTTNTSLLNYCKNNVAPGYEGYKIHYKLLNPEPISNNNTKIIGDIPKLDVGDNYIYLDSGIVIGETANVGSSGGYRYINATHVPSQLRYKAEAINEIYKGSIPNIQIWNSTTNEAYGKTRVSTPEANFDTKAIYTVDYRILQSIAPQIGSIGLKYGNDISVGIINTIDSVVNINKSVYNIVSSLGEKANKDGTVQVNLNAEKVNSKTVTATPLTTEKTDLIGMVNEVFQFANDGKNLIKNAVIGKGVSVGESPSFGELASGVESISTKTKIAFDKSINTLLYSNYMDKNKYVLDTGEYYVFTINYTTKKVTRALMSKSGTLVKEDYVAFESYSTMSYSFVFVYKDIFFIYHNINSTNYRISLFDVHTLNLIKTETTIQYLGIRWGYGSGVGNMITDMVYCVNKKYVVKADSTISDLLLLYTINGSYVAEWTLGINGATFVDENVIMCSTPSNFHILFPNGTRSTPSKPPSNVLQLLSVLINKFEINFV